MLGIPKDGKRADDAEGADAGAANVVNPVAVATEEAPPEPEAEASPGQPAADAPTEDKPAAEPADG